MDMMMMMCILKRPNFDISAYEMICEMIVSLCEEQTLR